MNWHVFGKAFLCETLYSIPFFILALFPFRKQLRFSLKSITFFIFLGQLFQSSCYVYLVAHGKPTRITDIIFAVVCLNLYFLCVKANAWKLLFLFFFIFNYMVTLRGICFFLESWFFSGSDLTFYSLHNESMLIIFVFLFFTLPLGLRFMKNARERVFEVDSPAFWHKAWFLPFSGTFIVCVHNFDLSIDVVRTPRFILTRIWLLLMTVLVYSILLEAFDIIRQQTVLKERAAQQETLLAIQRTQYQQLSRHMETVRQARHDLRQHLNVIDHYLSSGKTEDLKSYIEQYRMTLPPDTGRTWCENYAVNTIVCYYGEEARKAGIDFSVRLELPKQLSINEPELCSILGNLLENALDACRDCTDTAPFIRIRAREESGHIALAVDNTCGSAPIEENGQFRSTKHEGFGTGTASVRAIAQRHQGVAEFRHEDGIFYASVFI